MEMSEVGINTVRLTSGPRRWGSRVDMKARRWLGPDTKYTALVHPPPTRVAALVRHKVHSTASEGPLRG